MTYSKIIVVEALKSTFLSVALFTLFDILIQGYSNYHDWVICIYLMAISVCYFISRRYLRY